MDRVVYLKLHHNSEAHILNATTEIHCEEKSHWKKSHYFLFPTWNSIFASSHPFWQQSVSEKQNVGMMKLHFSLYTLFIHVEIYQLYSFSLPSHKKNSIIKMQISRLAVKNIVRSLTIMKLDRNITRCTTIKRKKSAWNNKISCKPVCEHSTVRTSIKTS